MKTTRYFEEQVLRKRPYIQPDWIEAAVTSPVARMIQADGRIRCWGRVHIEGEDAVRYLRVVLLEDGETVHNAFLDRDFREDQA